MKLIYIANVRMPSEKAHGYQIIKTCEAFASVKGIEVELIAQKNKNNIYEDPFAYYKLKNSFKIRRVPSIKFNWLGKYGIILQRKSFAIIASFYGVFKKADIVYTRHALIVYFFYKLLGKKVAIEFHEPPKRFLWFYRFILKFVKKKIIVAYKIADIYKKFNINKNTYIVAPNGVDLDEFNRVNRDHKLWINKFGIEEDNKIILYVGHFYKWKGVYTLIDSIKYLDSKYKIVLLGGTKTDQEAVKEYINYNKLKNVYINNFVPHYEAIKFIKSADALVLPNTAKEERSSKYTTPIKLFEYMASKVPIIASELDSFKKYLRNKDNAIFFKPDNPKDLADKILYILDNNKFANTLSEKAYKEVQEYTWEKRAKKIVEYINN